MAVPKSSKVLHPNVSELSAGAWWLSHQTVSALSTDQPSNSDVKHYQITFHEAVINLELTTHVALGGNNADLATKASRLRDCLRALGRNRNLAVNGVAATLASALRPTKCSQFR